MEIPREKVETFEKEITVILVEHSFYTFDSPLNFCEQKSHQKTQSFFWSM